MKKKIKKIAKIRASSWEAGMEQDYRTIEDWDDGRKSANTQNERIWMLKDKINEIINKLNEI